MNKTLVKCSKCDKLTPLYENGLNDAANDVFYCEECVCVCEECTDVYLEEDLFWMEGRNHYVCEGCRDDYYFFCEDCGEWDHLDDSYLTTSDEYVCTGCREDHYIFCDGCDRIFRDYEEAVEHNGSTYCENCGRYYVTRLNVKGYGFKPSPKFHTLKRKNIENGHNTTYGLEIEVELREGIESEEANEVIQEMKKDGGSLFYFKEDGSLNNGFEIVTHPFTFNFAKDFDWSCIGKHNGSVKSFRTSTCGTHIHIGREFFTSLQLFKFCQFFYRHKEFTERVIQRTGEEVRRWSQFSPNFLRKLKREILDRKDHPFEEWTRFKLPKPPDDYNGLDSLRYHKKSPSVRGTERYTLVNCRNEKTIEFRGFKGNIKRKRILKNIEFLDSVHNYTLSNPNVIKDSKFKRFNDLDNYISFINSKSTYKNLNKFVSEYWKGV